MTLEEAVVEAKRRNPRLIIVAEGVAKNPAGRTFAEFAGDEAAKLVRPHDVVLNDDVRWVHLADIRI